MPLPMPQFGRRPRQPSSPISSAMAAGLTQLVSIPFENRREKRAEQGAIRTEARADTRQEALEHRGIEHAMELLRGETEYRMAQAPKAAEVEAAAAHAGAIASGTLLSEQMLDPAAISLYNKGLLPPSKRIGGEVFFDIKTIEAARAGQMPVSDVREDMFDRISQYFAPDVDVSGPTTEDEAAKMDPILGRGLQMMNTKASFAGVAAQKDATAEERRARLILSSMRDPDAVDWAQVTGQVIDTPEGSRPFTQFDVSAQLNAPRLRFLDDAARNEPAVRAMIERADEIDAWRAEGKIRRVHFSRETLDNVNTLLTAEGGGQGAIEAVQTATGFLAQLNMLWDYDSRGRPEKLDPSNQLKIKGHLKANDDLRNAYSTFRTAINMQEVIDSEKFGGGVSLTPGALGYLQIMFRQRGDKEWQHPRADYDFVNLPTEVINLSGVVAGRDIAPPTPRPPTMSEEGYGAGGSGGLPGEIDRGEAPVPGRRTAPSEARTTGAAATYTGSRAGLGDMTESEVQLYDEMYTQLLVSKDPAAKSNEFRTWITEGHETPASALSWWLELGVPEQELTALRDSSDLVKNAELARLRRVAMNTYTNARDEWLAKKKQ